MDYDALYLIYHVYILHGKAPEMFLEMLQLC